MRILVPALATCLLLPAPALAGEPGNDAANVTRELNDPARQQQIASAMEVMMQAMLEMPAAPLLRAAAEMNGEDPEAVDPDKRIADLAGPGASEMPHEMARRVPQMMGTAASLATVLASMLPELQAAAKRMEDAAPGDNP
jgi:hypothetical protein